jgi:hypothetical protein
MYIWLARNRPNNVQMMKIRLHLYLRSRHIMTSFMLFLGKRSGDMMI